MAASRALPKVFTGGRSTSVRCVAELESPRSRAGYGVGLTECSPANRALEGMEKRCTRNSLSLSILPKTTDLACGAIGQPSLLVHSHTEPCVCVMLQPHLPWWRWVGSAASVHREHSTHLAGVPLEGKFHSPNHRAGLHPAGKLSGDDYCGPLWCKTTSYKVIKAQREAKNSWGWIASQSVQ